MCYLEESWESDNSEYYLQPDTEDYQPYQWDIPDCALYCSSSD